MLRIITWDEGCKPMEMTLNDMKWDTITMEPFNLHPRQFLYQADHWVRIAARALDELIIIQTIDLMFLDALRVALKANWTANEVYVYEKDGMVVTNIDKDGRMDYWPTYTQLWGIILRRLL